MKPSTAANLAVVLAVLAWPLTWHGTVRQLRDYARSTPPEVVEANQHLGVAILALGLLCLLASLWLSGHAFAGARIRSTLAATASVALVAIATFAMWT
jgi:hypothetical protein